MKISLLTGVLVLALLTIPAAVAAGSSTIISGTIQGGTTINVNPSSILLGTITPPHTYDGLSVTVTVTTGDSVNWNLQALDTTPGSGSPGFMNATVPAPRNLTAPFKIKDLTLATPVYVPLGAGTYTWYNGHGTGTTNANALFHQDVTTSDLAGNYSLVVTFIWVAA